MCRLACILRELCQDAAISVAPRNDVTELRVLETRKTGAPAFVQHVWVNGKHVTLRLVGSVVIQFEGFVGQIVGVVVIAQHWRRGRADGELTMSSNDGAGDEPDPFVRFDGKPAFVEFVDREGEQMSPRPVFRIQFARFGGVDGKVDENLDFVRSHCR